METMTFCQSCAMPLKTDKVKGTNANNSINEDYCTYCFRKGQFIQDCTMDEMIEHCVQFLDEFNKDSDTQFTREEAINEMKRFFPTLKRWSNC